MNKFVIVLFVTAMVGCITAGPVPENSLTGNQGNVQPAVQPAAQPLQQPNLQGFLGFPMNYVSSAVQGGLQGLSSLPNLANNGLSGLSNLASNGVRNTQAAILSTVSDGNKSLTRLVTDIDGKINDQTFRN